jgi:pyruvate/2-oxoglutarate dehydrogenase complex dihydrolipoamide dehydrogenase (E3) component
MDTTQAVATYDAIIIGAGISGLHQLHRLREMGMKARGMKPAAILAAPGTGIAILVRALIRKAGLTAIPSPKNY